MIVIENNMEDYEILKLNIQRNNCQNIIIPVKLAAGSGKWDRKSMCKVNTLENIIDILKINDRSLSVGRIFNHLI